MSIKIYDAYEFHGSLFSLMSQLEKIKEKYNDAAVEILKKFRDIKIPKDHVSRKDIEWIEMSGGFDTEIKSLNEFALRDILNSIGDRGMRHILNFEASAVIYPYIDNRIFINFFGLSPLLEEDKVLDQKLFTDFHYQNQTDRDESISDEGWTNRMDIWHEILLDKGGIPGECGFIYNINNNSRIAYSFMEKIREQKTEIE